MAKKNKEKKKDKKKAKGSNYRNQIVFDLEYKDLIRLKVVIF